MSNPEVSKSVVLVGYIFFDFVSLQILYTNVLPFFSVVLLRVMILSERALDVKMIKQKEIQIIHDSSTSLIVNLEKCFRQHHKIVE